MTMTKWTNVAVATLTAFCVAACSGDDHDHDHGGAAKGEEQEHDHEHGPHGGHVLEVGAHVAHLEMVHDDASGRITLYVLGPDVETPMELEKAPELKLATADGPQVLTTEADDDTNTVFSIVHAALRGQEPEGRISLEVNGMAFHPDLAHDHDH